MSRLRQRLAKKLQATFPEVEGQPVQWPADDIKIAEGFWRSQDCYRWEAWAYSTTSQLRLNAGSYDTLTACVRTDHALTVPDGTLSWAGRRYDNEISARPHDERAQEPAQKEVPQ